MSNKNFDATMLVSSHPNIVKKVNNKSLFFSGSMLVLGLTAFILTFQLIESTSTLSMALMVLGSCLFLFGTFRLFWKSKQLVYDSTGSVVKEYSLFFNLSELHSLTELIERGNYSTADARTCDSGGNIRMDVILSNDLEFAAAQLFQFVPYEYSPVTPVVCYTSNDASQLAEFLKRCEKKMG